MVLTWKFRAMAFRHYSNLLSLCDHPLTFYNERLCIKICLVWPAAFEVVCFYFGIVFYCEYHRVVFCFRLMLWL